MPDAKAGDPGDLRAVRPGCVPCEKRQKSNFLRSGRNMKNGNRKRLYVLGTGVLCAAVAVLCVLTAMLFMGDGSQSSADEPPSSVPADAVAPASSTSPEPEPEPDPVREAEERIEAVKESLGDRCTGNEPQIKDPATWNDEGQALYEKLMSDPYLVNTCGLQMDEKEGYPYLLAVNRIANTVTVLTVDDAGNYTVPYMAFVCSTGNGTPLGFYATYEEYNWKYLFGPCYGQYAVRFWGSYLFHSVPYYTQHQDNLEYEQYNLLGSIASLGCVRLAVVDIKWLHDNCPLGTRVVVYDDEEDPGPMGKPGTIYADPENAELRGWDPTDPDERNPWDEKYRPGTAIRSDAAWEEYNAAMEDGRWDASTNATALRGYSTDAGVAGNPG